MLEGKRFFPETGTPILKIARKMVLLAVELPEPFLVPTVIEKSLTTLSMRLLIVSMKAVGSPTTAKLAPRLQSFLWPVIQKVSMSDERLIPGLIVSITDRFHHFLVVLPNFL